MRIELIEGIIIYVFIILVVSMVSVVFFWYKFKNGDRKVKKEIELLEKMRKKEQ